MTEAGKRFRLSEGVSLPAAGAAADGSVPKFGQWIGNKEIPAAKFIDVENPTTHEIIAQVPEGESNDATTALELAKKAQPTWAKKPVNQRAKVLRQLAAIIRKPENRQALIDALVSEQPKILPLATVEIDVTADYYDFHASYAHSWEGEIVQSDNVGEHMYVHYLPIGVSVGIVPWNFPFFVMARKIAPALLSGCTVVVKTSEFTPVTSFLYARMLQKAIDAGELDLPVGVISILTGLGRTIGNDLCTSKIPGIISMTGSVQTGQIIMRNAAANMTKVSLELGGKAPAIVMEDADLDLAVNSIVASRVIFTGQVCNCAERVYVHESVYDKFLPKLVEKMKAVKVGAPKDEPAPDMCGLVNKDQCEKVAAMVERAVAAGAKVECGGAPIPGPGYKYPATVLTNVKQDSEVVQSEVFGPVLPVLTFKTFDEVIEKANDCEFGLASSIFTNNYRYIERCRTELLFGETYVNRFHFEAIQGFHAGWRKSGLGGADGKHGLMEYFNTKVMYVQQ